jgi:sterol desaturase/sphingolipid hydroxylase (fatty acid hydroxylase superfamily)
MTPASLTSLVVGLVLLGALFWLVERVWGDLPKPSWLRRAGARTDLAFWFFTPLVTKTLTRLALALVIGLLVVSTGRSLDVTRAAFAAGEFPDLSVLGLGTQLRALPIGLQIVLGLLLTDLIAYWTHRAFHRGRLWDVHAVHHSSKDLDWFSSARLHPLNDLATRVVQAVPVLLLGFDPLVFVVVTPVTTLFSLLLHANVNWSFGPLRYVITSPVFHRWHHTSEDEGLDTNFAGLFPVWDLLFGTFHMPEGRRPTEFGVQGDTVPEGFLAQLAYPFRPAPAAEPELPARALAVSGRADTAW